MGAEDFLKGMLRGFYSAHTIGSVPEISAREFGFGVFGKKISSRHLAFRNAAEMNSFLREKTPFYISYSDALYSRPADRPMEKKGLLGADLIYEFDADDIKTDCKLSHDSWQCMNAKCGASGKGNVDVCAECGSGTSVEEWVCPDCLAETRRQSLNLISVLEKDFSFSEGVSVNFSGSKGYHVHVRGASVRGFSKAARLELLDYLTGTNLDLKALGFVYSNKAYSCPKRGAAKGWSKRILERIEALFNEGDASKIAVFGSASVSQAKKLLKEKQGLISSMDRGFLVSGRSGVNAERFWGSMLGFAVSEDKLEIDRQTSIDINKIIRVPDTLHGSTGLQAKEVPLSALPSHNPLKECVVFSSGEVKLSKAVAPKFYLNGEWFGPFNGDEVPLPSFAAFYLLARGSAELVS
ncbi:MAG: DNA primase small subunit domain-containing protein [archaeon]